MTTTERRSRLQEGAGEESIVAATESWVPELKIALDLLGAGAVDESAWSRRERKLGGSILPKVAEAELAGVGRSRQAMAGQLGFR
jgi:hypothetical protein